MVDVRVKYKHHKNNKEYISPTYFDFGRAEYLVDKANKYFINAHHWVEREIPKDIMHRQMGKEG